MSTDTPAKLTAPPLRLLALELRAWAELGTAPLRLSRLRASLPPGDGHAVLVVPGFGAGDLATQPLRSLLRDLGYAAYGWNQGINLGMRADIKKALNERLVKLHARHGGPVSLIGWSLGGVFVREMARYKPELVRRVFTLGSPINERPDANNMMVMFRLMNAGKPVLALRRGGALETVREGVTGEFFDDPIPEALADALRRLNNNYPKYNPKIIKSHAAQFSSEVFKTKFKILVEN